jgi:hypothetical protein
MKKNICRERAESWSATILWWLSNKERPRVPERVVGVAMVEKPRRRKYNSKQTPPPCFSSSHVY